MKMRKLHLLALVALIMVGLAGCEKATVTNEATADAYIKSIKNAQGVSVYVVVHSVFSYNVMKSVNVTSPDGTTKQLPNYQNAGNSFFNEPVDADYQSLVPAAGAYTYTVTFNNGEVITYSNTITNAVVLPPNITSLAKTTAGDSVYIAYDAVATAHGYQVKIMKGTELIYSSDPFSDTSSPKKANLKIGFKISNITSGGAGTFTFHIAGLLYETTNYDYLQAISEASKDIAL